VKILFDTNTPAPLARALRSHQVTRTGELGWASLENGKLLDAAERGGFEVLITCDQNMRYPVDEPLARHTAGCRQNIYDCRFPPARPSQQSRRDGALIEEVSQIQRIPLLRRKPGVADQPPQFFLGGFVVRARRGNHVFFDHDAPDVIAAEAQPQLARL